MGAERYIETLWMFGIILTGAFTILGLLGVMLFMYRMVVISGVLAVVAQ
jgi:hypothetical protein